MKQHFAPIIIHKMQTRTKIYTVSQVNLLIKTVLENNLPGWLTIRGEITGWKVHSSGHCYFSLKDESSQLPCVMWASNFSKVKFEPENGLEVIVEGYIDVYPPQGKYQLYVETMQPAGIGALWLAFEQMVKKLQKEGLFDEKYKKPLPAYPQRIGIITSESGAAVHDIADSIHNRWPCAILFLYPVQVQGEGAADQIAAAIRDVNKRNHKLKLDILIVGRGGGSMEDLWAFNEEIVARAIFESNIPIISAVGHEIDTTITDLVADKRASTPTKAGVVAVPDMYEVLADLKNKKNRLNNNIKNRLELAWQNLQTLLANAIFRNPLLPVANRQQQLDELQTALINSVKHLLSDVRDKLYKSYQQVVKIEPHRLIGKETVDLNNLKNQANTAIKAIIHRYQMQLAAQSNRLAALNPKAVLQRGYSITTLKKTGTLIRKPQDVQMGDLIVTELANENFIESKITKK